MSLLGLLGQQSKSDEPEDETELEPEPEPTWRMVLLLGDEMKEVEIPEEGPKVGLTQSSSKSLHLTGDKNDPTKPIFPDDADGGDAEPASNVAPVSEE